MSSPRNTSALLVLRAALLGLLTGCGIVTNTNAPKPVSPGASPDGVPVAPSGLQLGYIWHSGSKNLYPILGVSGAAHLGDPALASDSTVVAATATTSLAASWGLVLHQDGTLQQWSSPATSVATLAAGVANDSAIRFSPSGTSAAVVSPSALNAVMVTGLPTKPQVANLKLPAGFSVDKFAISDGGSLLAGVAQTGVAGLALGILSETHSFNVIGTIQAWGGAGFLPGASGDGAVIGDAASGALTYATNLNGTSPAFTPLGASGLLQKPVAVAISADGKWAYAADSAKPQIVRVSIGSAGTAPSSIACACTPQQLIPLTADGIFAMTKDVQGQPAWILDTRTSQARTFFVPALPGSVASSDSTMKATSGAAQ